MADSNAEVEKFGPSKLMDGVRDRIKANEIAKEVTNSLRKYINTPNITMNKIKNVLKHQMIGLAERGLIQGPISGTQIDVKTLWQSWSFTQKIKWIFLNYLGLGTIREYEIGRKILIGAFDGFNSIYHDNVLVENIENIIENFEKKNKPWYYESHPKQVILTDVAFCPVTPLKFITLDIVINKEKKCL